MSESSIKRVFLFDVDNTLLDDDQIVADLRQHLENKVGKHDAERYWKIVAQLKDELGYADYLGALQRYRCDNPHDLRLLTVSCFLIDYPFADRLFPRALEVVKGVKHFGVPVILSDGDVVFQPHKVDRSGLLKAIEGKALIYIHKEKELEDVAHRFPADHYVVIDDKPRILDAIKKAWGSRVTTVFVRQGQEAHDPKQASNGAAADVTVRHIGDLLEHNLEALRGR